MLAVRLAVLFIILDVVGSRFSLSRPAACISLGLAQAFRVSHLIRVNTTSSTWSFINLHLSNSSYYAELAQVQYADSQ